MIYIPTYTIKIERKVLKSLKKLKNLKFIVFEKRKEKEKEKSTFLLI
jgi:hypothetical protein